MSDMVNGKIESNLTPEELTNVEEKANQKIDASYATIRSAIDRATISESSIAEPNVEYTADRLVEEMAKGNIDTNLNQIDGDNKEMARQKVKSSSDGFAKSWLLGVLTGAVSVGMIVTAATLIIK